MYMLTVQSSPSLASMSTDSERPFTLLISDAVLEMLHKKLDDLVRCPDEVVTEDEGWGPYGAPLGRPSNMVGGWSNSLSDWLDES